MPATTDGGESLTLRTPDGVRLHAHAWGDRGGPVVVLLHGGGANLHWWTEVARALADRHRVVALDFRGHGDSDHPEERFTGAFHRDLEALLAFLAGEPGIRVLVGHSLGARIALDVAAERRDVRGVVAVELSAGASRAQGRRMRLALATRRSYPTRAEALARYQFLPEAPGADEALRLRIAERSLCETAEGRFTFKFDPVWFRVPPRDPADPADVSCPVLLVRGALSSLLTADAARDLVAALPDGRLREVAGAGHNVHVERPAEVAEAVRAHVARCLDDT